jgi:mannose-6-phosphate isomerase-like protein (cupin superfamily)
MSDTTITFPSGEVHEILRDDAEALVVDVFKEPTDEPNVLHVHGTSDERFDIFKGRMLFTVAGHTREVGPGDFVWIPRGVTHQWRVIGDEPLHGRATFTPDNAFDDFLRAYGALLHDGRANDAGMPGFRDFSLLQRRHWQDLRVASHPNVVLRAAVAVGTALAWLTGRTLPASASRPARPEPRRRVARA